MIIWLRCVLLLAGQTRNRLERHPDISDGFLPGIARSANEEASISYSIHGLETRF